MADEIEVYLTLGHLEFTAYYVTGYLNNEIEPQSKIGSITVSLSNDDGSE